MNWEKSNKQKVLEQKFRTEEPEEVTFFAWRPILLDKWYWLEEVTCKKDVWFKIKKRSTKYYEVYNV